MRMDRGLRERSSGSEKISLFTSLVLDLSVSVAYLTMMLLSSRLTLALMAVLRLLTRPALFEEVPIGSVNCYKCGADGRFLCECTSGDRRIWLLLYLLSILKIGISPRWMLLL